MNVYKKKDNWTCSDVIDRDGYYRHAKCGTILMRVSHNTTITNCYCYCKRCKKEIKLQDISNGKIIEHLDKKETA